MRKMNNQGCLLIIIGIIVVVIMALFVAAALQAATGNDFKGIAKKNGFTIVDVNYVSDKQVTFVYSVDQEGLFDAARNLGTTTIYYDTANGGLNSQLFYFVTNGTVAWNYRG